MTPLANKKEFSDSQGPDDTIFDEEQTCVTMLAKPLKSHGIYVAATNERAVIDGGGRRRIYTTKPPTQQLAFALCHDRYRERTKDLLARIFHGSGRCVADRSIAAIVMDKLLEACTLTSDEQPSRSRFVDDNAVDSYDEDESDKVLGTHSSWSKRAQLRWILTSIRMTTSQMKPSEAGNRRTLPSYQLRIGLSISC